MADLNFEDCCLSPCGVARRGTQPTAGVLGALLQPDLSKELTDITVLNIDASDLADCMAIERAVFVVNVDSSAADDLEYSRDESNALLMDIAL
jgi:hypothetical protein